MPSRLATSLLTVDTAKMHQIDTRNVENLYSMWSVFSKCAESMDDGRRLENLSWRIWNRETLCCESQPHLATTPPIDISSSRLGTADVPALSASVDSVSSDEEQQVEADAPSHTAPMDIKAPCTQDPHVRLQTRNGREKHITSLKLEKMVVSIKEKQKIAPLSPSITDVVRQVFPSTAHLHTADAPLHSSDSSASTAPLSDSESDHSTRNTAASDTSAELLASHSVVRGFSPGNISSSHRSKTHLAPSPIPAKVISHGKDGEARSSGMFMLGGSSGEDDSSFDDQMLSNPRLSSLTVGLKRPLHAKQQTSFKDEVESRTINNRSHEDEEVFESDDEDEVSESAIEEDEEEVEDDDGSDWEDSTSETAEPMANDKHLFQRVDSRPNLVSRRSLLTTLMHQPDRATAFASMASKSTSALRRSRRSTPSGPSTGTSPEHDPSLMICNPHMTPSKPIIMTTSNTHPPALSPRSTRRNMLAAELPESLRKHLLWERQQKSTTANAVLKRRHTAHDMANIQEYPGTKSNAGPKNGSKTSSWNHYFDHGLGEYNQAGWGFLPTPWHSSSKETPLAKATYRRSERLCECCRAGNDCPFVHDSLTCEPTLDVENPADTSHPIPDPGSITSDPAQGHSPALPADGVTPRLQNKRRYKPPAVDASRVVQKPVSRFQEDSPREFQIRQLERRFSSLQKEVGHGETTLSFQLLPSDPDFPFELAGLDCVLHVPDTYPKDGRPSLAIKNKDMPRGYQINVERGFDGLVQKAPQASLLSLMNILDKQLEALLTEQKAETVKIMPNMSKTTMRQPVGAGHTTPPITVPRATERPKTEERRFTPEQRHNAQARREAETRQLEARLGRLPLFSKSADGIVFTIPITPRNLGELPVPLQSVRSLKLIVPILYPLQPCRIEIPGVSGEVAQKTERVFDIRAKSNTGMTLMAHVNYVAQHMHEMATVPEMEPEQSGEYAVPMDNLRIEDNTVKVPEHGLAELEDDRSHIKVIPRPPEWATHGDEETDSESDFSDSYDSWDEFEEEHEEHLDGDDPKSTQGAHSSQPVERGISLSFPSLELYNIELLELVSVSLSVKCARCKTSFDIPNLRPSNARSASCSKCAQPFSLNYRTELIHANSHRAGYLDLTGCTVVDMLPSTFIPTCSTCSTSVPSQSGVVSVRGDAASIAICRECHTRLTFKIPETKFMLVSDTSLHPRNLLPLRRKKAPKENLGIVAGQELPRRGRCRHYGKSYRWFRFSCCAKVYACDRCHDEAEQHPNEHANRMICGFCSREQNYRPEDCAICRKDVVGKKGSGFWEGGKGTRDKSRMSRKDPRKYKRRPGTRVGGPNKGGKGGGGESAKKN
ncbi:MAG: hypothetical protein Q9216_002188 [Gyalolechia sp. 2 TL-2023]